MRASATASANGCRGPRRTRVRQSATGLPLTTAGVLLTHDVGARSAEHVIAAPWREDDEF